MSESQNGYRYRAISHFYAVRATNVAIVTLPGATSIEIARRRRLL